MNKCKNCLTVGSLKEHKGYEYQFEESDEVQIMDVFICQACECLHRETETSNFYEFYAGSSNVDTFDKCGSWATDHNKKELEV